MFRTLFLVILLSSIVLGASAQTLTLEACLDSASAHMPLLRQRSVQHEILETKLQSYSTALLPALTLNGQVSYQSAVPELPFSIPGSPGLEIPKGQYRTYAEIYQPLFDGGISKALKAAEQANYNAKLQGLEVGERAYRKQVAQLYFQILLLEQQLSIVSKTIELLETRITILKDAVANGVAQENDLLKVQSEHVNQTKRHQELESARISGEEVMEILTGMDLTDVELVAPEQTVQVENGIDNNPELKLIIAQQQSIRAGESLIGAQRQPRVGAFGQAGLGAPNPYNFFEKDLSSYYLVGLRLNWTIYDWGKANKERKNLRLNQQLLSEQYDQKQIEIQSNLIQLNSKSELLLRNLLKDQEVVDLRRRIRRNAAVQLEAGVITNSDYLEEILAEQLAELSKSMDQIQLYHYKTLIKFELGTI